MSDESARLGRRDLLRAGAVGLAAAVSSGCAAGPALRPPPPGGAAARAAAPNRRVIGRTGLEVPVVSLGVMNADNPNLVRAALDGGIGLLDTAHVYQNGRNEEMIGQVLKGRRRDSFVLCTKVLPRGMDRKTGLIPAEATPEELLAQLDVSLTRLGLDHVDVLYLHNQSARESVLSEPMMEGLARARKAGKARFLGVTTHRSEPVAIRAAIEAKLYDVVLTAYNFRQDHHLEVERAIEEAAAAGLGVVAMKTQAGVFWDKEKLHPIDPKAALRWALRDPSVHTAIPGCTTLDQLQTNLEVLGAPSMGEADCRALEPAKVSGFYCQGCQQCRGPCPEDLPIPDLMRSYMYAHAYRNRLEAQALLLDLDLPASPCTDCASCAVRCAKGFDVRERVTDIVRLRDVPAEFLA